MAAKSKARQRTRSSHQASSTRREALRRKRGRDNILYLQNLVLDFENGGIAAVPRNRSFPRHPTDRDEYLRSHLAWHLGSE